MKQVNLVQGSPEWHAHRAEFDNASDAPAMLGESKYKTRTQLLDERKTGITPEVDAATQLIFDKGHHFEALARPLAEKIIGDDLSPTVGIDGSYSASFDGITFDGSVIFEHKTLNKELMSALETLNENDDVVLPVMYRIQMEQQLMVSGADKCLFMASKWDDNDNLVEEHHCWYYPDLELRKKIVAGWEQFAKDLETHTPSVKVEKVEAETVETLPVPSVVVSGSITKSNLAEITPLFDNYLSNINTSLSSDQDFADAEANAKNCRETAKRIKSLRENIIAQMADVNAVDSALSNYEDAFNKIGLQLEKAVKEQKETLKTNAVLKAQNEYSSFIAELNKDFSFPLHSMLTAPDFGAAIKGVKTIESMQSRLNNAVAKGKTEASSLVKELKSKLAYINEAIQGYEHLFDVRNMIGGDIEHTKLLIKTTIDDEEKRLADIKEKAAADERAKLAREADQANAASEDNPPPVQAAVSSSPKPTALTPKRPTADALVSAIAKDWDVDRETALEWLITTDFTELKLAA